MISTVLQVFSIQKKKQQTGKILGSSRANELNADAGTVV